MTTEQVWLTTHEAAEYSRRHHKTVLAALQDGELRGNQPGPRGHWRTKHAWVDAWIEGKPGSRSRKLRAV